MPLPGVNLRCRHLSVTLLDARTAASAAALLIFLITAAACGPSDGSSHYARAGESSDLDRLSRGPVFESAQERIKAVVLDAREDFSDSTLAAIRDLGATHVTLVSFGFQENASAPAIRFSPDVRWYSESTTGAKAIAERARAFGLGIILKPQLWLRGGAWTADIGFADEQDWLAWESDYRDFLLHTARLAAEIDADMLIIGTELSDSVQKRPAFWRSLIEDVRNVFDGKLTYGANWHEDYEHVPFWEDLDYIGVQAYFPISTAPVPTMADLQSGWRRHSRTLEELAVRENRPILFTELGYRSVPYAAAEPWKWPSRDEIGVIDPDYGLQSDLFRAFFDTVWPKPWFAGAIIWKMYPQQRLSERAALDFTPQDKPAEDVIRRGFRQ